jgi:2-haloacid dehalogenase
MPSSHPSLHAQTTGPGRNARDALGATWSGYTTLWVNRYRLPFEELGTQPSRTGADLRAVLDFFNP